MNDLVVIKRKRRTSLLEAVYIFLLSSVLGWLIEVGYIYTITGKIVDRGMLYGPVCTIYGIGALILYLSFGTPKRRMHEIIYIFVCSSVLLGAFELISGLFLKYALGMEMWNYNGQLLEIFNYTTIPISLGWGLFACIYIFLIQPILLKIMYIVPMNFSRKLAIILLTIYFVDYCASMYNIANNPEILYNLVHP